MNKIFLCGIFILLSTTYANASQIDSIKYSTFGKITVYHLAEVPDTFVIFVSGDGGWTSFNNSLGESLASHVMPVVGLASQKYFWNLKSPDESADEVAEIVKNYMQQWNKGEFILDGYSFGAWVIPFIAEKLPDIFKESLVGLYSLSPDETADFEIHIGDMLYLRTAKEHYNVPEEINKIRQLHPVCIFGLKEDANLRNKFDALGIKMITIPGNHHYNNKPEAAAEVILNETLKNQNR